MGIGLCWLSACGTTKYLQEDESFVQQNIVTIETEEEIDKPQQLEADLLGIVLQKPNTRFFGINRRWFYYRNKKKGKLPEQDEKEAGDRHIYEIPILYDSTSADQTVESMSYFLQDRGYFRPSITYQTDIKKQHADITYIVDPGPLFTIDSVQFNSVDSSIQQVLNEISHETVLQKGLPVSNQLYEEEKRRITNSLRNRGYREFYVNYIDQLSTETDTSVSNTIDLLLTVFPRNDGNLHQTYRVGTITVYPYFNPSNEVLLDTLIDNVLFRYPNDSPFPIKPSVILKRIALETDSLYSQENFNKTVRNLSALGTFKFANVSDQLSSDDRNIIDFNIFLPDNKKIVLGADIEIRNTFSSTNAPTNVTGNFLGGALNLSYRNRNLFRGSEDFQANFQIGGEFGRTDESGPQIFRSFDINPRFELNIPKFSDPIRLARFIHRLGFFSNGFYNSLLENATTRISFGVNWSSRRNFWGFFSGDFALGYTLKSNPNRQYYFNQVGFSFFNPDIGPNAQLVFENNPFLERSFNSKQLFTGLLFRDFGLTFSDRIKRSNDTWRINGTVEVSGLEVAALNGIVNLFREENVTFRLFDLDYSKFARLELDGSYYKYISARQTLAFRLNTGVAFSYAQSSDVPYVKQFFAGGPASVRAWKIRELGPGGYQDPSTFPEYGANTTPFYQTGNFKFIFSAEYRFKLFKLYSLDLEGAFFIDGGNVWTLRADPDRPNAELDEDFFRQIALGTGVGVRMDFEYFTLALDMGYRVRNPYPNPEGRFWAYQRWRELKLRGINYNLSVGYPF